MNPGLAAFHLGYRRNLDGVRGFAILLVLLDHGKIIGDGFGFIGVNTFFVLSGFLITSLLIEEYDASGKISFRFFYLRRALRLLPALIAMLVAFVIFVFLVDPHKRAVRELYEAFAALFYFTNWAEIYQMGRHISLAHTWSLSIEEQFYFIWPVMLWGFLRSSTRSSLLCWIMLGIFLSVLVRIGLLVGGVNNLSGNVLSINQWRLFAGTDTRADSLLLGSFAAVLVSSNFLPRQPWFKKTLALAAIISGAGLLVLGASAVDLPLLISVGWLFASLFGMGLIVHAAATDGLTAWILGNVSLVFIGQISYGLYIWHFPILVAMQQHNLPWQHLLYLIPVFAVALLSYYFIERPFLKLKHRFQKVNGSQIETK